MKLYRIGFRHHRIFMFVVIDSSVLIAASLLWTYEVKQKIFKLSGRDHQGSSELLEVLKQRKIKCIITKTVENEAKNALRNAVGKVLQDRIDTGRLPDFLSRFKFMELQDIVTNESLDRLEKIVEEYSTRLPIDISERERIKKKELITFFDELIPKTIPFFSAPFIPRSIKGSMSGKEDIIKSMVQSLPKDGIIIYKGYPENKDLTIMAEAIFIYRKYCEKDEVVYVASLDNNFKPNPKFVGNPTWPFREAIGITGIDSTVRDMLFTKFRFMGEHPKQLIENLKKSE